MRRPALALAAALTALVAGSLAPAQAITNGDLDGDDHPYVGLMRVFGDPDGDGPKPWGPGWRCSGALVSPTLFVTAGHCTESPADTVRIWFDADVVEGEASDEPGYVEGVPYTHPQYDPSAFYLYDLGVVVLDEPVVLDDHASLPELGALDGLKPSRKELFTAVGYGLQRLSPSKNEDRTVDEKTRMVAEPHLVQIDNGYTGDYSFIVSGNAKTGGTCSGDSGGPVFLGGRDSDDKVIAGVVSFGKNPACGGQGGIYRLDTADDLDWLYSEFSDHLS